MKSREQIARDRDFDWNAFLRSWEEHVKLGVGRMLMQHGLGGPPETGISEYIKEQTRDGNILELLQPVAGSLASPEGVHELIREGQDRLRELSERADLRYVVSYEWEVIRNGGISFGRADATDVESLESRLNVRLPPSYKAFLLISNGWITSTSRLVPIGDVQRFAEKDPKYVKDWHVEPGADEPNDSDYYKYGVEQLPYNIRTRYLADCLLIGEPLTEVNERLLLNPHVQFVDEEWEAWFMSPRLPGAIRFQSFVGLMDLLRKSDEQWWRSR